MSPIPQTSFFVKTFFAVSYSKPRVCYWWSWITKGRIAWLCRGFNFYEVKKKIESFVFQKENGNTSTLSITNMVRSLQKEQIAQIIQYDPWSAGINLRSTQSDLTARILTLPNSHVSLKIPKNGMSKWSLKNESRTK